MENGVNCHGKSWKSHGILLSDFCGNPVCSVVVCCPGDHCYKKNEDLGAREQMITSLPDVKSITLDANDEFMVLACDGIWYVHKGIAGCLRLCRVASSGPPGSDPYCFYGSR